MNSGKLILAFIRRQPLTWSFHVLALSMGVAVVTALLALGAGVHDRFKRDLAGIDLVVGAKGSPLQLILSSVYQLDAPTGNIPLSAFQILAKNRLVKRVVPVSIGDNVGGYRIVGTTPDYGALYGARLAAGRWWRTPMEAVAGAQAAAALHLRPGASFNGAHGLAGQGERHGDNPYRLVGILAPTGAIIDRTVLTDTASVWKVHESETDDSAGGGRQVTALLITYRSLMGAVVLPTAVKQFPDLQSAVPAIEVARLDQLLGTGAAVLRGFGIALLGLSALGFALALFAAVSQHRRELALLRALGARPRLLFGIIAFESLTLGLAGGICGIALGRAATAFATHASAHSGGPAITAPTVGVAELEVLAVALCLSFVASVAPAFMAYRIDPATALRS